MAKPRFYGKTTACTSNRSQDLRWMKKNTRNRERAPRPLVAGKPIQKKEAADNV